MERLLNPDTGLMIWTIVTFLVLVFVLGKVAWKPLLRSLKDREDGIRKAIDDAQAARQSAEQMKAQYERDLAQAQTKAQDVIAQAERDGQRRREQLLKQAEEEAQRLTSQTRRQLEEDKEKISRDLRKEVAGLTVKAAEKILRHSVNAKDQEALLQEFFRDLDKETT